MTEKTSDKIAGYKVKRGMYMLLSELFKVLSSPTRIQILHFLYPHSERAEISFGDIMFGIRKNPSTINFHLNKLMQHGLIEKVGDGNYRITEIGVFALKADPANIIAITEKAIEVGKTKGYLTSEDSKD